MYSEAGKTKKEIIRAKLLLEEALIKYQSRFGEDTEIYFRSYKVLSQYRFSVHIRTAAFDPFTLEENPMAFMIQNIVTSLESGVPTWKYRNLENEILFSVKKKKAVSALTKIAIALAFSAIAGVIARAVFSNEALLQFSGDYLEPLSDAYAGLFCVMAVLLTFFSIETSIVHLGDMASVGALGGKIMRRFFGVTAIAAVIFTMPVLPFFEIAEFGEFKLAAKSVYDILIGFIPVNIVSPFLNFNSVHIMLIGAMFGFSLLAMGQKGSNLSQIFEECNLVAVYTNDFFNRFIYIYVGLKVFSLITVSDFSQLAGAGKMLIAIIIAEAVLLIFYTVYAKIKTGIRFSEMLKAFMPATIVCLSSANFGAAFNTVFDGLFKEGVDSDTANLSVNLGSVFFQPACTVVFVFSSLFMASSYGVEISVVWIITAVVLSIILVGSMPNIPGASVSVITLLYAQLGIPAEGVALVIAINALLQFLTVGVDAWCLQAEILCVDSDMKKAMKKAGKA